MENEFILTSKEFATLLGISTESLRSRRRRGEYFDLYILKNKNYLWKRPAPKHRSDDRFSRGPSVLDESRLSAQASNTNNISHLPLAKRKRNKNSGNHKRGARTSYPNKAFELANEFKMIAKAQRKISAAGAAEITDDVIKIAEQKHRDKLQEAIKPIKTVNYTSGIYDCRNEILTNNNKKKFRFDDDDPWIIKSRYY